MKLINAFIAVILSFNIFGNLQEDAEFIDRVLYGISENEQRKIQKLYKSVEKEYAHIKTKYKRFQAIKMDPYFNALQVKFAYAITCHKAQGGQWKKVFIEQGYLHQERIDKEYLRWLYTAFTRAVNIVYLIGFKSNFFK